MRALQEVFGNCAQPLVHRGTVDIAPTLPADATRGALDVYGYQAGGGDAAYGIAARFFGSVKINNESLCFIPVGGIIDFYGTAAELTAATDSGVWALCDGSNGTPDLGGRMIIGYDPGGTYGTIGATGGGTTTGAASGNTDAASGNTAAASGDTASATTGVTVSNHTGLNTDVYAAVSDTKTTGASVSFPTHNHSITFATTTVTVGAGTAVITSINGSSTSPQNTGATAESQALSDPGHFHTSSHAHAISTITHTVNDSGHVHGLGSHVHGLNSHTHGLGSHTHTQALPVYMVLAKIMRIA